MTNKIYVANVGNSVTVIDGASNATTTVSVGNSPIAVALNPVTNKIYVADYYSANVTVIDGATNSTTTVSTGTLPRAVAVNPVTNKIYVANYSSNTVTVIDGATNSTTTVSADGNPLAVAVNPVTNKIYVANYYSGDVTVIDGATNSTTTVGAGTNPCAVALNPVTNKIYVANYGGANVTVIDEQQVQSIPLEADIAPLADNVSGSLTPAFTFTAESSFGPFAPDPDNLFFQTDTWQGPWTAATAQGYESYAGTTVALQPGIHILYAYATDGQDATSTMGSSGNDAGSSPLVSNIAAYLFLVSPPSASLSPGILSFGNQVMNTTSVGQPVTLTNNSGGPLTINGIATMGDYSAFDNCPATLQAGQSCTIEVSFTPTVMGRDDGLLTVTDNNLGEWTTQPVPLLGTGIQAPPTATLSPTSLSYGNELIGTQSAPQPVTLTNNGGQTLNISSIQVTSNFLQNNNCGSSLAGGSSCTISVVFAPLGTGDKTGAILITDNAAGSPQAVALSGTGTTNALLTVTPTSLSFGNQVIYETSVAKTVTLTNSGTGTVNISSIAPSGSFAISAQTCGTTLAAGAKCTVKVNFTPTVLGALTGALTFIDNAPNSPQTVPLSGTGVVPATLTPATATYATQAVGTTSAAKMFTLTNNQTVALTSIAISTTGDFAVSATTCTTSLAAKAKCTISVSFTPAATGTRTGTLSVSDSASNSPQTAALSGTGVLPATLTPASVTYVAQTVNTTSAAKTFTLTNNMTVTMTGIAISTTGDFAVSATTCTTSLAAKAKCTISVTFTPTVTGARTGELSVSDSASNSPQTSALSGTGK